MLYRGALDLLFIGVLAVLSWAAFFVLEFLCGTKPVWAANSLNRDNLLQ